jgi:protoporphyrin/coproporphyrin ferrochelatase
VLPFMENVTRGRGVPRERLVEVSQHYQQFGGVSPINGQNRALIAALRTELDDAGRASLPIYWGNRNWTPYLNDTIAQMQADGVQRAIAFVTSAYSSYSGCRQYREDIMRACAALDDAPIIDKVRVFYNHPGFVEPMIDHTRAAVAELRSTVGDGVVGLAFCAHSVPMSMADTSDYTAQLTEASRLVAEAVDPTLPWKLVFQSRSGPPTQAWLEPDISDHLRDVAASSAGVVMVPIGFISDHMEVVYDLDTQAKETAAEIGLPVVRAATVGTDRRFIEMIRLLIEEREAEAPLRLSLGLRPANHDVCPLDCCPAPQRPSSGPPAGRPGQPAA